jgi:phosphoribosylanthranilate isomerase
MIVKICGVRTVDAAKAATEARADLLGFNFAPVSRRLVATETARQAIEACRELVGAGHVPRMVGVFVNQPLAEVATIAREVGLDFVQLSGHEPAEYCRAVVDRTGLPAIKALRLSGEMGPAPAESLVRDGLVSILLADAPIAGSFGGSGQAWSWQDAASLAARFPVLLAGGLTAANVAEAARQARPWGLDVASGVETDGQTDPDKVRTFVQRVRDYEHSHTAG